MKFEQIDVIPINIPMIAPIRWAWGIREGITRNIVRVRFSNGVIGYGETMGGENIACIMKGLFSKLVGADADNFNLIERHAQLLPYFQGYSGYAAVAGIEMATWDALGKARNKPVYELLGGKVRTKIPFSAYVFYRYPSADGSLGGEDTPEKIAAYCEELHANEGFYVFKLKGGVFSPETDIASLNAIRGRLGENVKLRVDPNAVWSPDTVLRLADDLENTGLEYLEDPTCGLHAMARLRREIAIPMATNMCVVSFEDIPLSVRCNAVDIILGDPHKWGGLRATQRLSSVVRTFSLGMSLHSGVELGISTAANLHLTAAIPEITYAVDSHYHHLTDDILVGGKLRYQDGCMTVPDAPGLGVVVDEDRLAFCHERYKEQGAYPGVYDKFRPDWIPDKLQW